MRKVTCLFISISLLFVSFDVSAGSFQQQDNIFSERSTNSDYVVAVSNNKTVGPAPITKIEVSVAADTSFRQIDTRYRTAYERLKDQAVSIKEYANDNSYNSEYCFLIDMSIPSGKKRFFVYNISKDSVEYTSLVSHGFGSFNIEKYEEPLSFSNTPSSYKTSLGRYKVGYSYNGAYGLAYKLYGLDSTNNKAFERAIVLHSDYHVPEIETYPFRIFQSAGCPTVAPAFLSVLTNYIKKSQKPILMWIYN